MFLNISINIINSKIIIPKEENNFESSAPPDYEF